MKRTILITEPVNQKGIDLLKEQGYDVRMGSGPQKIPSSQSAATVTARSPETVSSPVAYLSTVRS